MIDHKAIHSGVVNHTDAIENAFSLFKRGLIGSYDKVWKALAAALR